jgi:DNA-binding CsgD family transcriptional regulator
MVWGLPVSPLARVEKHPMRPSGDIQVFSPEEMSGGPASNREIADRLVLSEETVRTHLHHIYLKLDIVDGTNAQRRALLVRRAIDEAYI